MTKEQKIVLVSIIIVGIGILGFLLYKNQDTDIDSNSVETNVDMMNNTSVPVDNVPPSSISEEDVMLRRPIPSVNPEQEILEERVRMGEQLTPEEQQRLEEYRIITEEEFRNDPRFRRDPRFDAELIDPVVDPVLESDIEN